MSLLYDWIQKHKIKSLWSLRNTESLSNKPLYREEKKSHKNVYAFLLSTFVIICNQDWLPYSMRIRSLVNEDPKNYTTKNSFETLFPSI